MCARKKMKEIKCDKCRYSERWREEEERLRRKKLRNKDTKRDEGKGNGALGEILQSSE